MLEKLFALHCNGPDPLATKTTQRYRESLPYLDPKLLSTPPGEIRNVQWTAEWTRLLNSGGHTRRDKTPRPLSPKSVRGIAGMVSSAYTWGCHQGFLADNPVRTSQRPKQRRRQPVTVAPQNIELLLAADGSFWCRPAYLAAAEAMGSRRGEILALRWTDWQNGQFTIARSYCQFKDEITGERRLKLKTTKGDETHPVTVPEFLVPILEAHRQRQNEFKAQFGPDYRDHDLIFCQENGEPLWPDSVSASVSRLCRQLKLPKGTSLHSLRHTHASVLLADPNVPLATVSRRLGHRKIRTTLDIYGHALHDQDDKAAQAYDDYRQRRQQQGEKHDRVQ